MKDIKFKLTSKSKVNAWGVTLFQIEATCDITERSVKKGDKGGWVESEKTSNGDARVSGNAWVYGNAEVSGDAWVSGNAEVYGNAEVSGDAWVSGNAEVYGNAEVSGDAWVSGNAEVYGDARVSGDAWVSGNAEVYGDARVSGNAWVYGNAEVYGDALDSGYCFAYKGNNWDVTEVPTKDGSGVLLIKDYVEPKETKESDTINIGGTEYEVTDELKDALKGLKEV